MASDFAKRLAKLAEREYDNYSRLHETTATMQRRIKWYWSSIGMRFPGVSTPWSAVFVSANVKKTGATASEFKFAAAHAKFVHATIRNAISGTGVFRAFPVSEYAPKVGDIIQNNRNGNAFDYRYAKSHDSYASHSAIVVEEGSDGSGRYVRTVGGNEGDRVGDRVVRLTNTGLIGQPSSAPRYYICVVQNLK